jgi:hypothetical protein
MMECVDNPQPHRAHAAAALQRSFHRRAAAVDPTSWATKRMAAHMGGYVSRRCRAPQRRLTLCGPLSRQPSTRLLVRRRQACCPRGLHREDANVFNSIQLMDVCDGYPT